MRHRGVIGCFAAAVFVLTWVPCRAQETKKAGPKLDPVKVEEGTGEADAGAGETAPKDTPKAPATRKAPAGKGDGAFGGMWFYVVLLGGFVLLYFWMGRGRRKQEAKRKEMLTTLKKGDKVVTIGGIMGTVIETRPEEVTVKVDETNNVRMKFARWSIRGVGEAGKKEADDKP
ncbi:MAG TPA: preprotein translocase subunit YajC [Phycisphaerae bacterium]|nr:preprotein translocase subunit YajC [Phycisphaerae bacterium]